MQGYAYQPSSSFIRQNEPGHYRASTLGGGPEAAASSSTTPFTFLLTPAASSSLETVEKCSVVVIGLWDSPRLLSQIQKLVREFHTRCGPVRAVHRFSVKPPACLLRPEYPGVALAVTFASEEGAAAAVLAGSGEGAGGDGTPSPSVPLPASVSTEGVGWGGIHGFRVSPMTRYRLSPEDAEDCRKTFMPISVMLRCMRQSGRRGLGHNQTKRSGQTQVSYLPPPHTLHPPTIANNSSQVRSVVGSAVQQQRSMVAGGAPPASSPPYSSGRGHTVAQMAHSVGEAQWNADGDRGTPEEQARMMEANDRWGIRDKLWFALCSDLSWYARIIDWTAAEAAAARGDAVVIDEEALCSVFNGLLGDSDNSAALITRGPNVDAGLPSSSPAVPSASPPSPSRGVGSGQQNSTASNNANTESNRLSGKGSFRPAFQFPLYHGSSSSNTATHFDALREMQKQYGVSKSVNSKKRSRGSGDDDQDDGNSWGTWIASWLNGGVGGEREMAPPPTPATAARTSSNVSGRDIGALVVLPQRSGLLSRAVEWLCPGWYWTDALQTLIHYRPSRRRLRIETEPHSSRRSAPLLVPFTCPPDIDQENRDTDDPTVIPANAEVIHSEIPASSFTQAVRQKGCGVAQTEVKTGSFDSSSDVATRFAAYREARIRRLPCMESSTTPTVDTSPSQRDDSSSSKRWLFPSETKASGINRSGNSDDDKELRAAGKSLSLPPPCLPSSMLQ